MVGLSRACMPTANNPDALCSLHLNQQSAEGGHNQPLPVAALEPPRTSPVAPTHQHPDHARECTPEAVATLLASAPQPGSGAGEVLATLHSIEALLGGPGAGTQPVPGEEAEEADESLQVDSPHAWDAAAALVPWVTSVLEVCGPDPALIQHCCKVLCRIVRDVEAPVALAPAVGAAARALEAFRGGSELGVVEHSLALLVGVARRCADDGNDPVLNVRTHGSGALYCAAGGGSERPHSCGGAVPRGCLAASCEVTTYCYLVGRRACWCKGSGLGLGLGLDLGL
jgi:hypothetical protein